MSDATREVLGTIGRVLFWCWIFGVTFQLLTMGAVFGLGDWAYDMYHSWFGLTPHDTDVIIASYIAMIKVSVVTMFFIPWLAIKMVLRTPKA